MSLCPCPYCRTGNLNIKRVDSDIVHRGELHKVILRVKQCNKCGSEVDDKHCTEHNKRIILAKREEEDLRLPQRNDKVVVYLSDWRTA